MEILSPLFSTYYGLDWLSMLAGFIGMYRIAAQKRNGFLISIVAFSASIVVSFMAKQYAFVIANCINIGIAIMGYVRFRPPERKVR